MRLKLVLVTGPPCRHSAAISKQVLVIFKTSKYQANALLKLGI